MVTENQEIAGTTPNGGYFTFEQMNAFIDFVKLWVYFVVWMRSFIYSLSVNHPNLPAVTNRVYREVPLDFYNSLKVFYGSELAEHFLGHLSKCILLLWRLTDAMIKNDQAMIDATTADLYRNAGEISSFLAGINSFWDRAQWDALLNQYISLEIEHIKAILHGDYELELAIYDGIDSLAIVMGSYMANGIISRSLITEGQNFQVPNV